MTAAPLVLTPEQARQIDDRALLEYGIPAIDLMENAGRGAAEVLLREKPSRVVVMCGKGNNGGDGFVVARHLLDHGIDVDVFSTHAIEQMSPAAALNAELLRDAGVPLRLTADIPALACMLGHADWIVDGLLGTGFRGPLRPPFHDLISRINRAPGRVLALDVPSGVNSMTGAPDQGIAVEADITVTFVGNKPGFLKDAARPYVGRIEVVDIGVPQALVEDVLGS